MGTSFSGGWNQEEGKDPVLVLSRTGYVITYVNCPIICVIQLQTEIALINMQVEYISPSQSMRDVLPFMSIMNKFFLTQASRRHSKGPVQSFWKYIHIL